MFEDGEKVRKAKKRRENCFYIITRENFFVQIKKYLSEPKRLSSILIFSIEQLSRLSPLYSFPVFRQTSIRSHTIHFYLYDGVVVLKKATIKTDELS